MVERGEVVVVVLDLRALHHPVAETDHHVFDLAGGAGYQVDVADRERWGTGQGDVDPVGDEPGLQLGSVELLGARREPLLQRLARLVRGGADLAPLLGGQLGDAAQDPRQLRFATEVADPQLLQLGGAGCRLDRRAGLVPDLFDPLKHRAQPPAWRATIAARRRSPRRPRR